MIYPKTLAPQDSPILSESHTNSKTPVNPKTSPLCPMNTGIQSPSALHNHSPADPRIQASLVPTITRPGYSAL